MCAKLVFESGDLYELYHKNNLYDEDGKFLDRYIVYCTDNNKIQEFYLELLAAYGQVKKLKTVQIRNREGIPNIGITFKNYHSSDIEKVKDWIYKDDGYMRVYGKFDYWCMDTRRTGKSHVPGEIEVFRNLLEYFLEIIYIDHENKKVRNGVIDVNIYIFEDQLNILISTKGTLDVGDFGIKEILEKRSKKSLLKKEK